MLNGNGIILRVETFQSKFQTTSVLLIDSGNSIEFENETQMNIKYLGIYPTTTTIVGNKLNLTLYSYLKSFFVFQSDSPLPPR